MLQPINNRVDWTGIEASRLEGTGCATLLFIFNEWANGDVGHTKLGNRGKGAPAQSSCDVEGVFCG